MYQHDRIIYHRSDTDKKEKRHDKTIRDRLWTCDLLIRIYDGSFRDDTDRRADDRTICGTSADHTWNHKKG